MQELHHVEIITIHDFYDHPISGLCKYDKEWYWYDWENYDKYVQYQDGEILYEGMRYMAHEILNYQLAYELYWHALFCTNVKTETTFSPSFVNDIFKLNEDFYEKQKKEYVSQDYTKNKVIGWFENYTSKTNPKNNRQ